MIADVGAKILLTAAKLYHTHRWVIFSYSLPILMLTNAIALIARYLKSDTWILTSLTFSLLVSCLILTGALIFRLHCWHRNIPNNWSNSIRGSALKILPLLGMLLVYSLIILSGTMFFVLPGLILMFTLAFSFILILLENHSILSALSLSHRLISKRWWFSLTVLITPLLMTLIVALSVFLILGQLLIKHLITIELFFLLQLLSNFMSQLILFPFTLAIAIVLLQYLHDLE